MMARWGSNVGPTREQKRALLWLRERGGAGSFGEDLSARLEAGGDCSPFVNGVWQSLDILGLVAIRKRKLTITRQGKDLEITTTVMENS